MYAEETNGIESERSFEPIEKDDLRRLASLAKNRLQKYFEQNKPPGRLYRDKLRLLCLCQGAAIHYLDSKHGIKDFDVWAFFPEAPEMPFPCRPLWKTDFGPSKFGYRAKDQDNFQGRRIDVLGRSIPWGDSNRPQEAVKNWLYNRKNVSSRLLSMKPVIVIYPEEICGEIIYEP